MKKILKKGLSTSLRGDMSKKLIPYCKICILHKKENIKIKNLKNPLFRCLI